MKFYWIVRDFSGWHPWFAWHPARIDDCECRWLETVERKRSLGLINFYWEYRPLGQEIE